MPLYNYAVSNVETGETRIVFGANTEEVAVKFVRAKHGGKWTARILDDEEESRLPAHFRRRKW